MRLYRNVLFPFYFLSDTNDTCPHGLLKRYSYMTVPIIIGEDKCKKCSWNAGSVRVIRTLDDREIELEYIKCTHEDI